MTISHATSTRNNLANSVKQDIDSGSGSSGGQLVFQASGGAAVATLTMSATSFGAAVAGKITANAVTDDSAAAGGNVTKFKITDRSGSEVLSGSVTATSGGGDIELSSTNIGAGDTVSVSSLTYEASQ